MKTNVKRMLETHKELVHSEDVKITSHIQREIDDWVQHTIMIENCDVPFKFKRPKKFRTLKGNLVNLTYYPDTEYVAGFEVEIMKVVRIKRA